MQQSRSKREVKAAFTWNRKPGIVVSIDSFLSRPTPSQPQPGNCLNKVTQARLAEGLQLHMEEMRIAQALREFRLEVERDLAAGSEVEGGDFVYDPELKIVRRHAPSANVLG